MNSAQNTLFYSDALSSELQVRPSLLTFLVLINSYSSFLFICLQMHRKEKAPGIKYYILMQLIKLYYLPGPL